MEQVCVGRSRWVDEERRTEVDTLRRSDQGDDQASPMRVTAGMTERERTFGETEAD